MPRYGRDFRDPFGRAPGRPDFAPRDRGYDVWPAERSGGRSGGHRGGGWGPPVGESPWEHGGRGGGYPDIQRPRAWQTGEPWGGESDADRVRAGDIMTRNPEAVTADTPLSEVAARMRDLDVGIIPVVNDLEDYRLQGVITDRDIAVRAAAEGKDMKKSTAGDHMTPDVETVGESAHVRDVFSVMKREQVRRVPVTDDQGRLVGIIAQADLAIEYAGLDLERETEVEEVIERISEPGRGAPRPQGRAGGSPQRRYVRGGPVYDRWYREDPGMGDRLRQGWRSLKREARDFLGQGYDRGWR